MWHTSVNLPGLNTFHKKRLRFSYNEIKNTKKNKNINLYVCIISQNNTDILILFRMKIFSSNCAFKILIYASFQAFFKTT